MKTYTIQRKQQVRDGLGGIVESWQEQATVSGYLDLIGGSNERGGVQNAITEGSSHILILPRYTPGIDDRDRVKDPRTGRLYRITYVDDPVGLGHHTELYLTYEGQESSDGE